MVPDGLVWSGSGLKVQNCSLKFQHLHFLVETTPRLPTEQPNLEPVRLRMVDVWHYLLKRERARVRARVAQDCCMILISNFFLPTVLVPMQTGEMRVPSSTKSTKQEERRGNGIIKS